MKSRNELVNYTNLSEMKKLISNNTSIYEMLNKNSINPLQDELNIVFPFYKNSFQTRLNLIFPPNPKSNRNLDSLYNIGLILNKLNMITSGENSRKLRLENKLKRINDIDDGRIYPLSIIYKFNQRYDYLRFLAGELPFSSFGIDYYDIANTISEDNITKNISTMFTLTLSSSLLLSSNVDMDINMGMNILGMMILLSGIKLAETHFKNHKPNLKYTQLLEKVRRIDNFISQNTDKI